MFITGFFKNLFFSLFILFMLSVGTALAESVVVQVASVSSSQAAQAEVSRLMSQGIPSFQKAEDVPGRGTMHRVYLGPFDSRGEAVGAADALKVDGIIGEYIIRAEGGAPVAEAATNPPIQNEFGVPVLPDNPGQPGVDQSVSVQSVPVQPGSAQSGPVIKDGVEYWPVPSSGSQAPAQPGSEAWGTTQAPAPVAPAQPGSGAWPASPPSISENPINGNPSASAAPPTENWPVPVSEAPVVAAPVITAPVATKVPKKAAGNMKIQGFTALVDLSSSMRRLAPCPGGLVKQEAVSMLLRRMNQRIPGQPYIVALRAFGYKQAWSRADYSKLFFGPSQYDRNGMESSIGLLYAADSVSPFGWALQSSDEELSVMNNPRAVLMFADFEETTDSGAPADKAKALVRRYGDDTRVYTYYVTRQGSGQTLAKNIAKAGGGKSWDVCEMLDNDEAFEAMMNEIFGPREEPPCPDKDGDGVCDDRDICPSTPDGAPVDERGCWIAAYSQFFDFDKAEVKSAFHPRIKSAAEIMIKTPSIGHVTIAGHTDSKGTDAYNMELGRKRAEAVRDLMVKFGAPADKLAVESYGKSRPIADNSTEEGRAKNRRVEFHVGDVPK